MGRKSALLSQENEEHFVARPIGLEHVAPHEQGFEEARQARLLGVDLKVGERGEEEDSSGPVHGVEKRAKVVLPPLGNDEIDL